MVKLNDVEPFSGIEAAPKNLMITGAPATVTVLVAELLPGTVSGSLPVTLAVLESAPSAIGVTTTT